METENIMKLEKGEYVVAGGRGLGGEKNLGLLCELACLIGGEIAASRGAVEEGWLSHSQMVGLSTKRLNPRLYVAFGISGANFHTIGMKNAEQIVAVNIDDKAPIFQMAHIKIIADCGFVLSELTEHLKKEKEEKKDMTQEDLISSLLMCCKRLEAECVGL